MTAEDQWSGSRITRPIDASTLPSVAFHARAPLKTDEDPWPGRSLARSRPGRR